MSASTSAPRLVVNHHDEQVTLEGRATLSLGRNPQCGLGIDEPLVSRNHATLWFDGRSWRLHNNGRNGTWVDGRRTDELVITTSCTVHLAGPDGPALRLTLLPSPPANGSDKAAAGVGELAEAYSVSLAAVHDVADVLTVGRAPDNAVVLPDLSVSRHHAAFRRSGAGWIVDDLGSTGGTFVDGRAVHSAPVGENSLVGIGRQVFRFRGGRLEEYQDTGAVTFAAVDLVVEIGGKRLLNGIDFFLRPNSMLVIIGPSGSGKTTLLRALTAVRPADFGLVLYGGRDFYEHYEELRDRIGFVPQDDILHPQLRLRDALDYAARLRFPADVDPATRSARVDAVLAELGLTQQAHQRIATLSGGQRKRSSTAMELLTRPSLLFLDEPTSGLDINRDREVMRMLRVLADNGRTVIVVSHNVSYIDLADRVLALANGGHLAYYGAPKDTLAFFGEHDWADMYAALERDDLPWRERYEQSSKARLERAESLPVGSPVGSATGAAPGRRGRTLDHLKTLCRRYVAVLGADRQFVALMLAMPAILALFGHAVPGGAGLSTRQAIQLQTRGPLQLLLVMVVGCCMMGTATSLREIVKERAILLRERAVGLSWPAYLGSKVVVLGVIVTVQAIVLTLLSAAGAPGPDEPVLGSSAMADLIAALVPVTVASMAIGLSISSIVKNSDRALPVLVVVLMAQLLFSGGLFPLHGRPGLEQLAWLSPARWGFAAAASVTGASRMPGYRGDPLWRHTASTFVFDIVMLLVITAFYLAVTAALVRRVGLAPRPGTRTRA